MSTSSADRAEDNQLSPTKNQSRRRRQQRQEDLNPFWFPKELRKAQQALPQGVRLTRSKLQAEGDRPQQADPVIPHSTPVRQVPISTSSTPISSEKPSWPDILIDTDTETESEFETIAESARSSPNSNIVSIQDSSAATTLNSSEETVASIGRVTPVILELVNRSIETELATAANNTTTTNTSFHSAAGSTRTTAAASSDSSPNSSTTSIPTQPPPQEKSLDSTIRAHTVADSTSKVTFEKIAVLNMAEKEPQKEDTITIRNVIYKMTDFFSLADFLTEAVKDLIKFTEGGYEKATLQELHDHHTEIARVRSEIGIASFFMNKEQDNMAEEYGLTDLLLQCDVLTKEVSKAVNDHRKKMLRDKQAHLQKRIEEQAKKEEKRRQEEERRRKKREEEEKKMGAKGGSSQQGSQTGSDSESDSNDSDESDSTRSSKSHSGSLRRKLKDLQEQLNDIVSNGQHLRPPFPIKKRPPIVSLQKFKGSKKDYTRFKQSFKDAFEEVGLSQVSLALNLNEFLEGEPRAKLVHMIDSVDDQTYETMWKCLDTFYGNEKEKAREKFTKFESMPAIKVFNASTISILITALESNWTLLKKYSNNNFLSEDNIHFFMFLKKIPLSEKDKFLDYCHYGSKKKTFPVFKEWLTDRWHRLKEVGEPSKPDRALQYWQDDMPPPMSALFLDSIPDSQEESSMLDWNPVKMSADNEGNAFLTFEAPKDDDDYGFYEFRKGQFTKIKRATFGAGKNVNTGPSKFQKGPSKALAFDKGKQKQQFPCNHCKKQGHMVFNCDTFKGLSVKERYSSVKTNRLCLRCLNTGHIAKDCRLKFVCDVEKCGKRHHRLLHPTETSKAMYLAFCIQGLGSDLEDEDDEDQLD